MVFESFAEWRKKERYEGVRVNGYDVFVSKPVRERVGKWPYFIISFDKENEAIKLERSESEGYKLRNYAINAKLSKVMGVGIYYLKEHKDGECIFVRANMKEKKPGQ